MPSSVTPSQYAYFEKRWEHTDVLDLDERIIPSVIRISEHPNIIPIWSCSGHNEQETKERRALLQKKRGIDVPNNPPPQMNGRRYIVFVIKKNSSEIIENFSKYLNNLSLGEFLDTRPRLEITPLTNFKDGDVYCYISHTVSMTYPLSESPAGGVDPSWLEERWNNFIEALIKS